MKRFIKVMLVIAAVFAVLGIGLSVGGAAMGATVESLDVVDKVRSSFQTAGAHILPDIGWDEDDWEDSWEDWEQELEESTEGSGDTRVYNTDAVEKLEVELNYDSFVMEAYDGDGIRVEVENDSDSAVKVGTDSDELKIQSSSRKKNNRSVHLYYPENLKFKEIEIEVKAGTAEIADRVETDSLKLNVGAGTFTNSDELLAKETEFEVGVGQMEITELDADNISGECGMGSISLELTGAQSDYSYKLECGVGNIAIGDSDYSSLGGTQKIDNPGASRNLELECGMGEIEVNFEND